MNKWNKTLPVSPNLRADDSTEIHYLRLKFSRRDSLAYIAHLDMLRLFERAILRSRIDCNYSQGFNPRPSMVFALPLGVGVETVDDYLDIEIRSRVSPVEITDRLNKALPEGIRILEAAFVPKISKSIMALVHSAEYVFLFPGIGRFCRLIQSSETLEVEKTSAGKVRAINIKDYIIEIGAPDDHSLRARFKAGSKDNLRPDLFLKAITGFDGFTQDDALDTLIIRTGTFADFGDGIDIRPIDQEGAARF
ncbi:MAG: TIGR03936 family radical SAM-associated protein [Saccharofermentanales bacterium]